MRSREGRYEDAINSSYLAYVICACLRIVVSYYSVRKFKNYGKLSGKNLDELEAGARVNIETSKQDPLDFVLWKNGKA